MTEQKPRYWTLRRKIIGGTIILVAVFAAVNGALNPPAPRDQEFDARTTAAMRCQDYIRTRLKAPSTAEFQDLAEMTAGRNKDGAMVVGGYVDAQNSFGAKLRSKFVCQLNQHGEKWAVAQGGLLD